MAKVKTVKELKAEASKVISEAKKQHKELMQKAKEIEDKKYVELGKKCVDFLSGKATQSDLKTIAVNSELIEKGGSGMSYGESGVSVNKNKDDKIIRESEESDSV